MTPASSEETWTSLGAATKLPTTCAKGAFETETACSRRTTLISREAKRGDRLPSNSTAGDARFHVEPDKDAYSANVLTPSGSVWRQRRKRREWWQKTDYIRHRDPENLKAEQVGELWAASNFASERGTPLNTWLTIRPTDTDPPAYRRWFRCGLNAMSRWLRRESGTPAAYVYVHEAERGLHFHMLAHVPRRLSESFRGKVAAWFPDADADVQSSPALRRDVKLRYMSKGAPQQVCRKYGGNRRKGGQGYVPFKRMGVSQSISRKARGAA